jgi:hypothetical protein
MKFSKDRSMKSWKRLLALGLFLMPIATAGVAQAQGWDRPYFDTRSWVERFDRRLNSISTRLEEARMNHLLSPREVRRLTIQRDRLAGMERDALRDRYITSYERDRLDSELRSLARNLRMDINDRW